MGFYRARSDIESARVSLVVHRADGTIEDLGIVASYDRRQWFKNFIERVKHQAVTLYKGITK